MQFAENAILAKFTGKEDVFVNKRDFYKELMSEYQFDKEKILANAKKGKFAGRSPMPIYIGVTAVAAAAVVGVGTFMFTSLGGNKGVDLLTGSTLTALSNKERIERAIEDIRKNENSEELRDVMVTFREPLSPAEVQRVLTENAEGNVPVKMLYFSDESRVIGSVAVGKVFDKNSGEVTGAVINCAGYLMEQLQKSSEVFTVEILTADDDLNVVAPIKLNDPEISDLPTVDIGGEVPIVPSEPVESTDSSDAYESSDSSDISDSSDSSDSETSEENSGESSDISEKPEVSADEMPEGVTLPESIPEKHYLTGEIGAEDAFFVDENTFFVISENSASIYGFDGNSESLVSSIGCTEPRVDWVAEDGSGILISTVDDGRRSKLFYADTQNGSISEIDVDGIVMTGVIKDVVYNKNSGILVLNVDEAGDYYSCSASFDGTEIEYLAVCYYSENVPTTVIAADENYTYICVQEQNCTKIVKVTTSRYSEETVIFSEDSSCAISPNFAGTHASVVLNSGSYIFDTATETMISAPASGVISFGVSSDSFACGGGYYTINEGQLSEVSGIDVVAKIDWRSGLSGKYQARALDGCVKITKSLYSEENSRLNLAFGAPYENASEQMRAAVNKAIGLQNALSVKKIKSSGISDAETLAKTMKAIYTQSAAETLKVRCKISGVELLYENGGLGTINASDTVLTITENNGVNASGVLYIKVGAFDGKIGYRAVSVKLVNTGAQWKIGGIIE